MYRKQIEKRCRKCKEKKLLKEFHNSARGRFGKASVCKDCIKAKDRSRYVSTKGQGKPKLRKKDKETSYGKINRHTVAKKLWSYRKRFRALKEAGVDLDFRSNNEAELIAHAELIDHTLNKAGLGDIRHDSRASLQQSIKADAVPGM